MTAARHLTFAYPADEPAILTFVENDGELIVRYQAQRSFRLIERDGRTFRLQGRDRDTGELVYLPEVELV